MRIPLILLTDHCIILWDIVNFQPTSNLIQLRGTKLEWQITRPLPLWFQKTSHKYLKELLLSSGDSTGSP